VDGTGANCNRHVGKRLHAAEMLPDVTYLDQGADRRIRPLSRFC
jgi:hypothetical protein